jgi:uncharacterized protein YuzE
VYAHYDREVDIAWFQFGEAEMSPIDHSEEMEWGLIDRDSQGRVVGLEFWKASERLPAALLDALHQPKGEGTAVERQSA